MKINMAMDNSLDQHTCHYEPIDEQEHMKSIENHFVIMDEMRSL